MVKLNSLCCAKLRTAFKRFQQLCSMIFIENVFVSHCNLFYCILYKAFSLVDTNFLFLCMKEM